MGEKENVYISLPLHKRDAETKQSIARRNRKSIGLIMTALLLVLSITYLANGVLFVSPTSISSYSQTKPNTDPEFTTPSIATPSLTSLMSNSHDAGSEEIPNISIDKDTTKRDDTTSDQSSDKKKSTPIYDMVGVRVAFVLVGFVLLNMLAIVIHHIFLKASRATSSYKNIELHYSPF
ncbi:uncharacterized protein RJT21DRAFT_117567 [Scheffersomyces amazonensis]|uniref:uncharacterized protein n=1 Tax=Scheffersomyces amazonensis TaxID=1078765 RepID=UPI00315DB2FC